MILLAASNPDLLKFVLLGVIILLVGSILRYFKQPYVIAYILAGVLMGRHCFQIFTDEVAIQNLGEFGLILLLFFIGMEISLPDLIKNWKIPTIGTVIQILASIALVSVIGVYFQWSISRIIVIGFIISLSSSAVVIKLLQDNEESQTIIGQSVISILLMQDILIVPMLILTNYLGGNSPSTQEITLQVVGGILIIIGIVWILKKKEFSIPFSDSLRKDHELQVFIAFIVCFGFAVVTSFFGLSAALGSFLGGMVVHAAKSTEWFHDSLHSFRVIFVAIFFASVGMLIDIKFIIAHWQIISLLLLVVYLSNHFINSAILHYFGRKWQNSLYGGALLAQIGELSFIVASNAFFVGIITDFEYQLTIIIISVTLLISPFWIATTRKVIKFVP